MLKAHGLLVLVLLMVAPRSSDTSPGITIYVGYNTYRYVTFSKEYFNQFYNCLCDSGEKCIAQYYFDWNYNRHVKSVVPVDSNNAGDSGSVIYYYCSDAGDSLQITCEKSGSQIRGYHHHLYQVYETECHYSCVVFIWKYRYEMIDFSNSELSAHRCYGQCLCLVPTTKTKTQSTTAISTTNTASTVTSTATKAITSTISATLIIATTTTKTRSESTTVNSLATESTVAAVPSSANDSNDDRQVGLIIGVVFAAIFIVVVIAVLSFIFWRRKQRQPTSKPQNGIQSSTALNELNHVSSTPDDGNTGTQSNVLYNVASVSGNYAEINVNKPEVSSGNAYENAKSFNQNSVSEAKTSSAIFKKGDKKMTKTSPVSVLKGKKTLPAGNYQKQTKTGTFSGQEQKGIAMTALHDGEYGYSTVQDQRTGHDDYHTAPLKQYDYATVMNSKNKDPGYEYAGPDGTHVTDTANKSGIDNEDGNAYSTAGNINNSIASPSAIHTTKDIYSRLHEESRQTNNPYNTLSQPEAEVHNSPTNTGSMADQPENVYSRLHEECRQTQNPYNTLLQPTEDAHVSQTSNQPSRYSFAQPISDQVSNGKTDSSEETSKAATSENHTY